ncbi:hypothetical protein BY458DRAFT_524776 [Sporodiniella umbellata]|nr:hypothetical protein BY458DRAFT_524776 [Sporodiniella umbellata]
MSDQSTTAREYVESYIQEYKNEQEYLLKEQPRYDPTQPLPEAPIRKEGQQQQQPETQPSKEQPSSFNMHAPTMNPIPSSEPVDPASLSAQLSSRAQRSELHNTSLTICADVHEELITCFQYGSWWDKAKMCEEQKQKFWKCYNAQKRFLKDVGYMGPNNTEKEDARILVAAYKLRDKMDGKTEKNADN